MNLRSLLQDILGEVSSRIISFQMRLHLLIILIRSSEYFRFIESLRTCIMASQRYIYSPQHDTQSMGVILLLVAPNITVMPSKGHSPLNRNIKLIMLILVLFLAVFLLIAVVYFALKSTPVY